MSPSDETSVISILPSQDEKASVIFASLIVLALDVVAYGTIAVHTLLCRRRYARFYDGIPSTDLSLPAQFFLLSPAPVYAAGFLLAVVALILKEVAIERKSVSLKVNLFALAAAGCLYITFNQTVHAHFEPMTEG